MCVPVTRCHPGFRQQVQHCPLRIMSPLVVCRQRSSSQTLKSWFGFGLFWLHQYFVVSVFCLFELFVLHFERTKREEKKQRNRERHTGDTDYPSVHLLYLLIFNGKAGAFRGKVGREHTQPRLNVRKKTPSYTGRRA